MPSQCGERDLFRLDASASLSLVFVVLEPSKLLRLVTIVATLLLLIKFPFSFFFGTINNLRYGEKEREKGKKKKKKGFA